MTKDKDTKIKDAKLNLSLRLYTEDEDRLKTLAALEKRSVSELISALCSAYVIKYYKPEYETRFIQPKEL